MDPILTPRLLLRPWRDSDRGPFAALNADPQVTRFFPSTLTADQSDQMVQTILAHWQTHGFGVFALELRETAQFIGFTGLNIPRFEAHFTPCVEIAWRLAAAHWNHGYASEAAAASLQFGFETLQLSEIVAFTVPANLPSRRVMEKIGMREDTSGAFDHPGVAESHPLRKHVLYRKSKPHAP